MTLNAVKIVVSIVLACEKRTANRRDLEWLEQFLNKNKISNWEFLLKKQHRVSGNLEKERINTFKRIYEILHYYFR